MTRLAAVLTLCFGLAACGLEVAPRPGTGTGTGADGVDQGTPKSLAAAVFAAAKSGNFAGMDKIASPTADQEVLDIANVAKTDTAFQRLFREHFATGRVVAEPYLDGKGGAFVSVLYGKAGDQEKLMIMAQQDGLWFFDALVDAIDQSSPEALAKSIFRAAKTGIYSGMKGVVAEVADEEVREIANVATAAPEFQQMFHKHFGKGKVAGEVMTKDDQAMVPILFGPDGDKKETLGMVRKDGRWFFSNI